MSDLGRRLDDLKAAGRPRPAPRPTRRRPTPTGLEEVVGGCEVGDRGHSYWLIETPFRHALPTHTLQTRGLAKPLCHDLANGDPLLIDPARTMILDIETGGFAGTPVFLIGVVLPDRRPLSVVQFLARDYPEEEAILRAVAELAHQRDTWVTFNGKSFDEPFLRDRATLHRVRLPTSRIHLDLLHAARRRWRDELPNCRLGTIEEHILQRPRVGDIPSSDVPDLFHHFIRTRNAAPLRPVLHHNQIDLISCAELLLRLAQPR